MASPASVPGHPIHPIIIPFPIGLGVFSLVADVIYLWRGNPIWKDWISFYTLLGGIVGAALAAVCGINRLANNSTILRCRSFQVPPPRKSTGRRLHVSLEAITTPAAPADGVPRDTHVRTNTA